MLARGMIVVVAAAAAILGQAGAQALADDTPSQPAPAATRPADAAPPSAGKAGTSATVLDVSAIQSVIGRNVKSTSGEAMGRIVDILVMPSGQVRAAVLDFGGVLGVGSRKIAVDWKALSFAELAKDGAVQVLLTRNQVRVAPEYKAGDPVVVLEATPEAPVAGVAPTSDATAPEPPPARRAAAAADPDTEIASGVTARGSTTQRSRPRRCRVFRLTNEAE